MLKVLWYIFLVLIATIGITWILDNNGLVIVKWLGYEIQTDILTTFFLLVLSVVLFTILTYLVVAILAIKFPELLKFFFKKSYTRKLEKIILRHHEAFESISQAMLALEVNDNAAFAKLGDKISSLTKNNPINNFLEGKQALVANDLKKAKEFFAKFDNNKHAKILLLKAKAKIAANRQDNLKAIAYSKQIIDLKKDSMDAVYMLLDLYKKTGMWQAAKELIAKYGVDNFANELQKHDLTIINTALAIESYQAKKFLLAIKYAKIAVKSSGNFLPANEIMIKSMIKIGFRLRAILKLKSLWKESPHHSYARLYEFLYRKSSPKDRIKAMKSLFKPEGSSSIENIILANLYLLNNEPKKAKELLVSYLHNEKTQAAYFLLAKIEQKLGDEKSSFDSLAKGKSLPKVSKYNCLECGSSTSQWSANCTNCGAYDSIEWNF